MLIDLDKSLGEVGESCNDDAECTEENRCGFVEFSFPAPNEWVKTQIYEMSGWDIDDQTEWANDNLTN